MPGEFSFRPAFTREAAYAAFLPSQRKQHDRILAETFKAEIWDKALEFSRRASEATKCQPYFGLAQAAEAEILARPSAI